MVNITCLKTVWITDMDWISNLPWAAFAKQKCILLSDCWFNPILYHFFIQIPYLPYSPSKTNVCISVCACVFNILAILYECHVMGHFASTLFGPLTQIEGNGKASLCGGWSWQQGFHHNEGSRSVSQTIGMQWWQYDSNNILMALKLYKKKLLIFELHTFVCMTFRGI